LGNLVIRVAYTLLVSLWPIVAGLIGFAIAAIADTAGNDWALVASICAAMGSIAFALLADLAGSP
jgi:hypothetical protein